MLAAANKATSVKQLEAARTLHQRLKSRGSPLDNFRELLLVSLGKASGALFDVVQNEYRSALSRDESFTPMLERIGSVFLGRGDQGGGLGGLLGSLLGGMR